MSASPALDHLHRDQVSFSYTGTTLNSITDTRARVTSFTYGASGLISQITDPAGRLYQYGYSAAGDLTSYTDPAGGVTTYTYDARRDEGMDSLEILTDIVGAGSVLVGLKILLPARYGTLMSTLFSAAAASFALLAPVSMWMRGYFLLLAAVGWLPLPFTRAGVARGREAAQGGWTSPRVPRALGAVLLAEGIAVIAWMVIRRLG